jgi:acyl carrier protein
MADPLSEHVKRLIVETLRLDDVDPARIGDQEPLIGTGLSLDSIDALELVVKIEKVYGIKIASAEESRSALASVDSLTRFIRARAEPARLPV